MLTISLNHDQSWSQFGVVLGAAPTGVDTQKESVTYNPLISWFYNRTIPIGLMTYMDAYGYHDPSGITEEYPIGWPVYDGDFDESRDYRRYGSFLDPLRMLMAGDHFDVGNDHECNQRTYVGRITNRLSNSVSNFGSARTWSVSGFVTPGYRHANGYGQASNDSALLVRQAYLTNDLQPHVSQIRTNGYPAVWGPLDSVFQDFVRNGYHSDHKFTTWAIFRLRYGADRRKLDMNLDGTFRFEYTLEHTHWGKYQSLPRNETYCRQALTRHIIETRIVDNALYNRIHPTLGSWVNPRSSPKHVVFSWRSTLEEAYSYWEPTGWVIPSIGKTWGGSVVLDHGYIHPLDQPRSAVPTTLDKPINIGFAKKHEPVRTAFFNSAGSCISDIRTSALNSTSAAISDANLSGNLENIVELRQSPLPSADQVYALADLVKGLGFNVETLADLINVLSMNKLYYEFGLRPTVEFLTVGLPALVNALRSRIVLVGRGKFQYDFPSGTFGRSECRLTARTKIVLLPPENALLSGILDLRRLGVDPTGSNLWNLIPLSFAADWITNIGNRLAVVEDLLLTTSSPIVRLVHSFAVETPLTAEEISNVDPNLAGDYSTGFHPPSLRWYRREISRRMPPFRYGRWDFGAPAKPPSWELVGSLVYQLIN